MKISVLGWYGHENAGDEAFKLAFPKLLPSHDLRFVELLEDDDTSDAYILGGGDIVYPTYIRFLKKFPNRPKIAVSVTLTPNSDMDNLGMFDRVYVRDKRSLELAQEHLDGDRVSYLPDVTFLLEPDKEMGKQWVREAFDAKRLDLYEKLVVVCISSYTAFNSDKALSRDAFNFLTLAKNLANVADNTKASFLFLPFSTRMPNDDLMSNSWVAGGCKYYGKNYVVRQEMDVQSTLNVLSAANAVVSTRLHSTIFSVMAGVPFIDLTHHSKNLGFIETIGRTNWSIPLWEFSVNKYKALLGDFVDNRHVPDPALQAITEEAREQLMAAKLF